MTYLTQYTGSLVPNEPIPNSVVAYLDFLRHRDATALDADQLLREADGTLRGLPVNDFLRAVSRCNVRTGFFTVNPSGDLVPPDQPCVENARGWLWLITVVFLHPLGIRLGGKLEARGEDEDDVWTLGLDRYQVPTVSLATSTTPWTTPADRLFGWLQGSPTARRRLTNAEVDDLIDKLERPAPVAAPQLTLWSVDPAGGPSTATLLRRQDPVRRTDWWRNEDYLRTEAARERGRTYPTVQRGARGRSTPRPSTTA
jgi:hypothetical protein